MWYRNVTQYLRWLVLRCRVWNTHKFWNGFRCKKLKKSSMKRPHVNCNFQFFCVQFLHWFNILFALFSSLNFRGNENKRMDSITIENLTEKRTRRHAVILDRMWLFLSNAIEEWYVCRLNNSNGLILLLAWLIRLDFFFCVCRNVSLLHVRIYSDFEAIA